MSDITRELNEFRQQLRAELKADMREANKPLERRQDQTNAHLRELNGKVAQHAVRLAEGNTRFEFMAQQIRDLLDDRDHYVRRDELRPADDGGGENRSITGRDVKVFWLGVTTLAGAIGVVFGWLKVIAPLLKP